MVQGGGQSKGGASKGGSSSEKLSEKKMRKMETRNLEEKLIVLRGALFEADGKDKDVCAALGPFMKYDRNGLDVKISFAPRLKDDVKKWAFKAVKDTMEDKYDAAGYGWDDADKLKELEEDGGRFLVLKEAGALVGVVHFRFTVQGDVVDKMLGDTVLMVHDLQIAPSHRRKGLGKHVVQLLEMAARKQKIARLSMQVMLGDDETRAFVASLKGGKFAADESLEALVGFDADLEGFDVMTLPLAPPVKKVVAVAEEEEEAVDEAAELRQTRDLLRQTVAEAFAKQHSLPELSKKELTVAILQYAKQNGFVSPAFSLPITLPPAAEGEAGESAVIPWYPGDSGAQLASEFAKQHGLGADQRIQILRGLIKEAKGRGLVQPIFSLNVALPPFPGEDGEEPPPPKRVPLDVYDGDDLETVAAEFTARHSLPDAYQAQVRQGLRQRAKEQGLVRALFELGVTLLSGEREVLKVYEGDNIDQVAIDFAIKHDLGHDEREALVAAVEEQAQARKLVQPLLFKLPVKVGQPEDPWIAQLYVHQGDVPAQIATTFVNRYSGWGNATETAIQITKAILEKAQNVNQAVDEAASRVAGEEAQSKR